jgi:hypothetical protein
MWLFIAYLVVVIAAAVFLTPKNNLPDVDKEAFETPTAKEGDVIPVAFGTVDVKSPNVVWYGNTKAVAIRKKGGKK